MNNKSFGRFGGLGREVIGFGKIYGRVSRGLVEENLVCKVLKALKVCKRRRGE